MPRDASNPIPVSNSQDYGRFDTPPHRGSISLPASVHICNMRKSIEPVAQGTLQQQST